MLDAFGVRLNMLMGQGFPLPAPAMVSEALESVEVGLSDREPSGFTLVFKLGKSAALAGDMPLLKLPALQAGARVVLTGIIGVRMTVLIDGIVETAEMKAGEGGTGGTLTLMGKDVAALMDKEERNEPYPAMGPGDIALMVLKRYLKYGIIPDVRPPVAADRDAPTDRTPMQNGTDLKYLRELAAAYDHIFTIIPGPVPATVRAYWGPLPRLGGIQAAITVDMGPDSNATGLKFESVPGGAAQVSGQVLDQTTGQTLPVQSTVSLRPPLAAQPAALNAATAGSLILRPQAGQSATQAMAQAQAQADATTDTVTVKGELDLGRYGRVLEPRKLVGLRGAGHAHDGYYYVRDVVHTITRGAWAQTFTLVREGLGTTTPIVRPS
jgi:hypothetical protein